MVITAKIAQLHKKIITNLKGMLTIKSKSKGNFSHNDKQWL